MEICLAVAPSTDDTAAVAAALVDEHDDVIGRRQPGRHDTGRSQRGHPGDAGRRRRPRRRPRRALPRLHPPRRRDAAPNGGGQRRRHPAGRRHDAIRASRCRRHVVAVRHRRRHVPLRRSGRADRHRLPRCLRPGGDRAGRPLRRVARAQPGLRAEHPPARGRRRGVVRPGTVRHLSAPRHPARPRPAVLRLRALEALGGPPAPPVAALAPGGAAGGDGSRRWWSGGWHRVAQGVAAPGRLRRSRHDRLDDRRQVTRTPRSPAGDLPDDAPVVGRRLPARHSR